MGWQRPPLPFISAFSPWRLGEPNLGWTSPFSQDGIEVLIGDTSVAHYVLPDERISRPHFADIRTLEGTQVTRNNPPVEGDVADHDTYHPGLWMAFGDISGSDFWRLKAPVKHVEFVSKPSGHPGHGSFTVRNRYLDQNDADRVVCDELCTITFQVCPHGYLILWDSIFSSDAEFTFGDQEEMGLGMRVATPIRVEKTNKQKDPQIVAGNGTILDSEGRMNGDEVWGQTASWCDYFGVIDGQLVGITIFCHPDNFRPSWFHARDYGLLLANLFGRKAFDQGEPSQITVPPGEQFRLRYGVFVHGDVGGRSGLDAAYRTYLKLSKSPE